MASFSPRKLRSVLRVVHLVAGGLAAFVVYAAPVVPADVARLVLAAVVLPVLTLSGVVMWQQARLRRLTGRQRRVPATAGPQG